MHKRNAGFELTRAWSLKTGVTLSKIYRKPWRRFSRYQKGQHGGCSSVFMAWFSREAFMDDCAEHLKFQAQYCIKNLLATFLTVLSPEFLITRNLILQVITRTHIKVLISPVKHDYNY